MALFVQDLEEYNILQLNSGQELKITTNGFGYGNEDAFFYIFPEERTIEEIEELFMSPQNTKLIIITDNNKRDIYGRLHNYVILQEINKLYQEAYHEGYDEQGNYYKLTTDLIKVTMRRPNTEDKIPQMQATMEYIAIMSDIDIDMNKE
jgi:hypothetical protein